MDLELQIEGEGLKQPAKLSVTGPYERAAGALPKAAWTLAVAGAGQNFSFTSTGDDSWLGFAGQQYEIGKSDTAKIAKALPHFAALRRWLANPKDEGSSKVDGVDTRHISAGLDVNRVLSDVQKALKSTNSKTVPQITEQQRKQFTDFVKKTRFDVYVGKDDHVIRRLAANISFQVPKSQQVQAGSLKNGTLTMSLQFSDVGKPQDIKAPAKSRPISALTSQFGGLAGLLGGAASGAGAGAGASSGGGTSAPSSDALQKYADCLRSANPNNSAQMQACNDLLNK